MPISDIEEFALTTGTTPLGSHAFSPSTALLGLASVGVSQAGPSLIRAFGAWLNITGAAGVAGWITAVGGSLLGLKWLYDARRTTTFEQRWSVVKESNEKELKEALAREVAKDAQIDLVSRQISSLLGVNADLSRYVRELTIAATHAEPAAHVDPAVQAAANRAIHDISASTSTVDAIKAAIVLPVPPKPPTTPTADPGKRTSP